MFPTSSLYIELYGTKSNSIPFSQQTGTGAVPKQLLSFVSIVKKEKMPKESIREQYKNLKYVEHAFRDMKTAQLDIRPIYHVNEDTTRGPIFVTMFAYAIVRELENYIFPWLKEKNKNNKEQLSLQDIEEELKMVKLNILQINKNHEEIKITELTNRQKEIVKALDLKPELLAE